MVQIYFLVVLCNLLMGFILAKDFLSSKSDNFNQFNEILSSEILQVTIGCIGTIVGILALFLRYSGNMIILGDLIPALIAIISGVTLFVEYIAHEENKESAMINFFNNSFIKHKSILGFAALAVAVLHFIAPSIELL